VLLVRGNLRARLARGTDAERQWLRDYLSFPDRRWGRPRGADQRRTMLSELDATFPSGFVPMVEEAAPAAGHAVQVLDKRACPVAADPFADLEWLKRHPASGEVIRYQVEAVRAVGQHGRGILHLPTGAGKTETFIGLTRYLPCPWLFLVHRSGLLRQTADRYRLRTGLEAGVVGDEEWKPRVPVTCATFQTVYAALKKGDPRAKALLEGAYGLCVDESHVLPSDSFMRVAMAARNAYYRVGLSGTPLARGDQKSVVAIGCLGPVIMRVKPAELQALGVLAQGTIHMVPCEQTADGLSNKYRDVYAELVVRSRARNELLVRVARAMPKPCLLFVKEIEHGRRLEKMLRTAGLRVDFVWGDNSTSERQAAAERLRRGDTDVCVCSVVWQEGVDIPELAGGVNAAGGKSAIAAIQRLGRTTRATGDKREFVYVDVNDQAPRVLARHARARRRAYVSEGHRVQPLSPHDLSALGGG
jgi:superfamily II DNA or RNA helicase